MKQAANRLQVPFIDLCAMSRSKLVEAGGEKAKSWYMHLPAGEYASHWECDGYHFNGYLFPCPRTHKPGGQLPKPYPNYIPAKDHLDRRAQQPGHYIHIGNKGNVFRSAIYDCFISIKVRIISIKRFCMAIQGGEPVPCESDKAFLARPFPCFFNVP